MPYALGLGLLATTYVVAARLGLLLATMHGNVSPIWPASGLAVAALLLGGTRLWPAVALGAFAANWMTEASPLACAAIAAGNTFEALVGAWLVRRLSNWQRGPLQHFSFPLGLIAGATVAPLIAAVAGVSTLILAGSPSEAGAGAMVLTWWAGDAFGVLAVAPAMVALAQEPAWWRGWTAPRLARAAALLAAGGVTLWFVFWRPEGARFAFLVFPLVLLALLWFGEIGGKLAALVVAIAGVLAVVGRHGPFVATEFNANVLYSVLFLGAVNIVAIVLPVLRIEGATGKGHRVTLIGWAVGGALFAVLQGDRLRNDDARFREFIDDATQRLEHRIAIYENALRSGATLAAATDWTTPARWRQFAEQLDLETRYPGLHGVGLALQVPPDQVDEFADRVRRFSDADFVVHEVPRAAPEPASWAGMRLVVTQIEPRAGNRPALGLDLASEQDRRESAWAARDSGRPQITPAIQLVQDGYRRAGFLFLVPFYAIDSHPRTVEERRAAFRGVVYAPFITEVLFAAALAEHRPELAYRISHGPAGGRGAVVGATPDWADARAANPAPIESTLVVGGSAFRFEWRPGAGFPYSGAASASAAGVSLALASVLLGSLVASLQSFGHRSEQLVRERTAQLETARVRLESILEQADCLLWDATVTIEGPSWTWDFSVQPSGLYKRLFGSRKPTLEYGLWYQLEIPEQAEMDARSREAFRTNAPGYDQEFRVIDGDSLVWLREKVTISKIDTNRWKVVAVVTDVTQRHLAEEAQQAAHANLKRQITERMRAEEEAKQARAAAETANRAKSEFLATMSHEIRTPMNSIIGFADLLAGSRLTAEQGEWVHILRESGRNLLGIISDILDFSKIEAGRIELEKVLFEPARIVQGVADSVRQIAEGKGLALRLELADGLPAFVTGDPVRLRQVVMNLATNAIKFTQSGHVAIVARWMPEEGGQGWLHCAVSDTGIGITGQQMDRLFQKFTQADSSTTRRFGGTGLGLAISKQLVELMGGRIGVSSTPGAGSTFWFELPLVETAPPAAPAAEPAAAAAATADRRTCRVLLAEDVVFNQRLAVVMLRKMQCDVVVVGDGREAVGKACNEPFDLILMDCQMPEMDGFEASQLIRRNEVEAGRHAGGRGPRRTPIVAMTANAVQGDRERCLAAGMDDYIPKPVQFEELARIVERWGRGGAPASA